MSDAAPSPPTCPRCGSTSTIRTLGSLLECSPPHACATIAALRTERDSAARVERDRIVAIIEANVPHDGYCSMDDCTGCEIVDRLKRLIERDEHEEAQ